MVSTFTGGQSYIQNADVVNYLRISDIVTTADTTWLDDTIIPWVCEYIDSLADTTWGLKSTDTDYRNLSTMGYEWKSIGQYASYGLYLIGAPIYLKHSPVVPVVNTLQDVQNHYTQQSLQSMLIWNGNFYSEWVGTFQEGRFSQYWTDIPNGIVYIMGWYWWMGYEALVQYQYGYQQTASAQLLNGVPVMIDPYVYELAVLKSAQWFLSAERYTSTITQGVGGIEIPQQWNWINDRIKELEIYVKGYKAPNIGWMS